jgi:hypothetical protein
MWNQFIRCSNVKLSGSSKHYNEPLSITRGKTYFDNSLKNSLTEFVKLSLI